MAINYNHTYYNRHDTHLKIEPIYYQMIPELKKIILDDIYNSLNNILINISKKYNLDYNELHKLYLSKFQ